MGLPKTAAEIERRQNEHFHNNPISFSPDTPDPLDCVWEDAKADAYGWENDPDWGYRFCNYTLQGEVGIMQHQYNARLAEGWKPVHHTQVPASTLPRLKMYPDGRVGLEGMVLMRMPRKKIEDRYRKIQFNSASRVGKTGALARYSESVGQQSNLMTMGVEVNRQTTIGRQVPMGGS